MRILRRFLARVKNFAMGQRSREFGIRIAVGATRGNVMAVVFHLKGEMDWHRNSRQAPWKLSSTDANRATRSLRRITGRNSGSWRLVAYSDVTSFLMSR